MCHLRGFAVPTSAHARAAAISANRGATAEEIVQPGSYYEVIVAPNDARVAMPTAVMLRPPVSRPPRKSRQP